MASIINATTTNGVAISADNSGILQLATNSGTTALTLSAAQAATFVSSVTATSLTAPILSSATTLSLQTNGSTTAVTIDASQSVGIGVSSVISGTTNTQLQVQNGIGIVGGNTGLNGNVYYASGWKYFNNGPGAVIALNRSSTVALEIDVVSNNVSGSGASATPIPAMTIDAVGTILATAPAGLGYGTGSGGTVTQATSKSTGVTLNKPTGQITMNNAALGAGASVLFVFSNTLMALNDCLITNISRGAGANPDNYRVINTVGSAGGTITVTNISAGSLSEAIIINFAIIKGATA